MDAAVLISHLVHAELIIVARKNRIENDARDRRDGEGGQGDGSASDMEGDSVCETESAYEDYRRDELLRTIEHALKRLTLQELEALYYDMSTKNYIND